MASTPLLATLLALASALGCCWAVDCQVDSIPVMKDFDKARFAGQWFAVAKKNPDGVFLQDNIHAKFTVKDGCMMASARGRVTIFSHWVICADMVGTFTDTDNPAKLKLKYWGLANYLATGQDDFWVVDTDYDSYAIMYSCRERADDGTCANNYSIVFLRQLKGMTPSMQRSIRLKQESLCLAGKYHIVEHSNLCP
ncbi:retinol-binding protein 4 [Petromyzon marinus]|uniref:Retinol-binding protein 4 n=1 Tax=Petromyzon marinus TaxID=7757 RepID=A0AAJ7WSC5_PETMA|nr:retinol-binding protein 4 [Petromyzon marinus]